MLSLLFLFIAILYYISLYIVYSTKFYIIDTAFKLCISLAIMYILSNIFQGRGYSVLHSFIFTALLNDQNDDSLFKVTLLSNRCRRRLAMVNVLGLT